MFRKNSLSVAVIDAGSLLSLAPYYSGQNWNKHCTSLIEVIVQTEAERLEVQLFQMDEMEWYYIDPTPEVDHTKLERNGTQDAIEAYLRSFEA